MSALLTEIYELGKQAIKMEREEQLRREREEGQKRQRERERKIKKAWKLLHDAGIADVVKHLSVGEADVSFQCDEVLWKLKADFGDGAVSFQLRVFLGGKIYVTGEVGSPCRVTCRQELAKALVKMYHETIDRQNKQRLETEQWRRLQEEEQRREEEEQRREEERRAELKRRQQEVWRPFYVYRVYYQGDGDTEDWIDCLHANPDAEGWWDAIKPGARVSQIRIYQPLWIERRVEAEPTNWVYCRDDGLYYPPEGAEFVDSG